MRIRHAAASLAAALAFTPLAHAVSLSLDTDPVAAGYGQWATFSVDSLLAPIASPRVWISDAGEPLEVTFTIAAGRVGTLTVVDAGIAGDTFTVTNFGNALGTTSAVPVNSVESNTPVVQDFDQALADPSFSHGAWTLGAGSYRIGGALAQSVTLGGQPLDATSGALRLTVSPVPEPSSLLLLSAGLAAVSFVARRRG